jgi:mutator protein MutT
MTVIVVAAAVIADERGILVTRRPAGVHLEGHWEFPGGKCAEGESLDRCLKRELREELAVDATIGPELLATTHDYADRRIELHFFRCTVHGEPTPQIGQEMRWVESRELETLQFPPADTELIALLTTDLPAID